MTRKVLEVKSSDKSYYKKVNICGCLILSLEMEIILVQINFAVLWYPKFHP